MQAFKGQWWHPLPDEIRKRIEGKSWKNGCPVPLRDLAYIQVGHLNFKNEAITGELVVHKNLAHEMVEIFKELFDNRFPIEKMVLIDDYEADDEASMEDNNSSAFCYRPITGTTGTFSKHSYGYAIDINPLQNPYIKENTILPKGAEQFYDRSQNIPGLIKEGDCCYQAFTKRGYTWGGHWTDLKDYHHFEKNPETFIS